jgi:hypothetical protein
MFHALNGIVEEFDLNFMIINKFFRKRAKKGGYSERSVKGFSLHLDI